MDTATLTDLGKQVSVDKKDIAAGGQDLASKMTASAACQIAHRYAGLKGTR